MNVKNPASRHYDNVILALQGGGALGAYQAGVFEGMTEASYAPNWVRGVSIGAINAALIAGNPPDRRVARLREFWDLVSSGLPLDAPAYFDPLRTAFNRASAALSATLDVPGFYAPRVPPAVLVPPVPPDAFSVYDTRPLQGTLERLVDFDLIRRNDMRLSLGSVTVICPGFVRTPPVDRQIPEQAKELGMSEDDVIRKVMLKETVDGEFTTVADVAEVALLFAAFPSNALTGQSLVVSHGWFMQ